MNAERIEVGERWRYTWMTTPAQQVCFTVWSADEDQVRCGVQVVDGAMNVRFQTNTMDPDQYRELRAERAGRNVWPSDPGA